ncbi:putative vacuolar protein sorting-associated protein 13F [Babesia sp. Xinjiang]|uniref:putative vacuolar protein sorting-associated protein 13F n=1 Tax=Babesia sp. Xinjiang TaxID=462227 RepID=UPI000A261628|nr:putative vacuolar protein sorting-associated protein 13F [Babesia sp. Xinjiang]ORM42206.1 putative vacuolar protein sorting-associated protein 13F [Babesia sp. Xinjiang]
MFEGLVKRLLDTYLAPYVDGITQNLQLAVWSGNIVLENLTLKTDITDKLALPFDIHFGRIGRLKVTIPWASLGTTPVKVLVDSLYLCISGVAADKSDEELLRYVRVSKEKLTSVLENEYSAFVSSLNIKTDVNSSYLIRLSQKVLNNIQIDFTNIHVHCSDSRHAFGFIIDSISIRKFRPDDGNGVLRVETNDTVKEEAVTHVCSLLGFSIYERPGDPDDDVEHTSSDADDSKLEVGKDPADENGDTAKEGSGSALALLEDTGGDSVADPEELQKAADAMRRIKRAESTLERFSTGHLVTNTLLDKLSFRLFLAINVKHKSIFASLRVGAVEIASGMSPNERETLRIVLSLESVRAFVDIWTNVMLESERSERLLMEKAYTVDLSAEGIKGTTREEYITLYTKLINSQQVGGDPLSFTEHERLIVLTDVVPARHLARWRFASRKLTDAAAASEQSKRIAAAAAGSPAPTTTTWFGWLKGVASSVNKKNIFKSSNPAPGAKSTGTELSVIIERDNGSAVDVDASSKEPLDAVESGLEEPMKSLPDKSTEIRDYSQSDSSHEESPKGSTELVEAVSPFVDSSTVEPTGDTDYTDYARYSTMVDAGQVECLPGGLVLTGEEVELIKDAMAIGDMFDDSMATSNYYFECVLPHFEFVIDVGGHVGGHVGGGCDSLCMSTGNLNLQVYFNAAVDTNDRDTYNAYFWMNLDSFEVRYKNTVIMAFLKTGDSAVSDSVSDIRPSPSLSGDNFAIDLRLVHKVTGQGNLIMVNGELKPMETHLIPAVMSELIEILLYIQTSNTRNQPSTIPTSTVESYRLHGPVLNKIGFGAAVDDELWPSDRTATRMSADHLPALFAFDIKFAAPILMIYNDEGDCINLRFGTLNLKSNGACHLSSMSGTIELKETQLSCLRHGNTEGSWYSFLRPLPVKIHYDCDFISKSINVDILFEELFMQATPMDTAMLYRIPSEIVACLLGARASLRRGCAVKPVVETAPPKTAFEKLPFNVKAMVIFCHSGFAVWNAEGCQVFKLDMHNVSLEVEVTKRNLRAILGLERIMMSNPAMDMPLFFTHLDTAPMGRSSIHTDDDDDNEFEDALEETVKSLEVEISSNDSSQLCVTADITEMEGNWQHSSVKLIIDTMEEYKQFCEPGDSGEAPLKTSGDDPASVQPTDILPKQELDSESSHSSVKEEHRLVNTLVQELTTPRSEGILSAGSSVLEPPSEVETADPILRSLSTLSLNTEDGIDTSGRYKIIRGDSSTMPNGAPVTSDGPYSGENDDCNVDWQTLPILLSEKEQKGHKTLVTVNVKGAAIAFWNAQSQVEARLSVSRIAYNFVKYVNCESKSDLEVGTAKLTYGNRCLLSYTDTKSLEEGVNAIETSGTDKPLMSISWKLYDSHNLGVPYSMCVRGVLERIVFVYFHQDISRLMDYLDDGILSVFISRSYHKVVEAAASTHMFYSFSVASPCFLIPENKAILSTKWHQQTAPGSTLPNHVSRANTTQMCIPKLSEDHFCSAMGQKLSGIVDTWYFGSYLLFELGHLYIRNGYTEREGKLEQSTIYLKLLGTRASIIEQTNGSTDVMGSILQSTDLAVCYMGGTMLDLGIDSEAWILKLTRMQLTFIVDVLNENVCGSSHKNRAQGTVAPHKTQSRCSIRLSLKRFEFDTLFASNKPLANLRFNGITVCLNYASDSVRMTSCYQFALCGKTLTVDDTRRDSINVHRRLINCFVHERSRESDVLSGDDEEAHCMEPSVSRLLQNWLRQYKLRTGHDLFSNASSADFYGIKLVVVNENNQTNVDCMVANADISLLCIHAMDLLRYFTLSYATSSMAMSPKHSQSTQPTSSEKTYTFNFKATNGKFIAFTRMDSTTSPQLELSTDFILEMTMHNGSFNFLKVDVLGCKLERVYPVSGMSQVLCGCLEVYGSGQYVSHQQGFKMFFNFTVPPSNLTLYTKDLSVILAAFSAVLTDGPSAAPPKAEDNASAKNGGSSSRFLSVSFNIKGIKITFFDDMRKCIVPMMRLSMASDNIEYMSLPIEKRYTVVRCSTRLEYFNAVIGDWEPFLERCNCSLEYTNNIHTQKSLNRQGKTVRTGSDDEWKDFIPNKVLKITSTHNILINITPSLCQLLLWFVPMLTNNIQRGLVYLDSAEEEPSIEIENSAYRYVNLTGHEYRVFTIGVVGNSPAGISGLRTIEKSNVPKELDSVVSLVGADESSSSCIYVVPRPPAERVELLCDEMGISNKEPVERDLMVTRSIAKTKANLSHSKSFMPSSYATPFENGTCAAMVPLARNCSVLLKSPIEDLPGRYNKDTMICEVKTPHPSHKLLMFTSTVRLYNRSGMPVVFTFLDQKFNVIPVSSLKTRGAPISILDKGGALGEEFGETTTVHFPESSVEYLRLQQEEYGYTMLLEHNHFASVPECAFQGPSHAVMSFLPAPLAMNRSFMEAFHAKAKQRDSTRTEMWMKLSNMSGWSKVIDSSRHQGTRVRQCYCPGFTKSNFLYFVVTVIKRRSAFPANVDMRDIIIYPALSVMNTLPMELDVCLAANDRVPTDDSSTSSKKTERCIQETLTLLRQSITHIYSLPPNESLSFMAKICYNGSNIWSERVAKIYGTSETHTMLQIPIRGMASVELELIRYPGGLPVSSTSFQGHLSLIINAPWWFMDRTGLGISFQRRLPRAVMCGLSFFSSEDEDDALNLCVNGKASDRIDNSVRMPAVGGYSYALVESGGKHHSVCLMTEKLSISGLSNHVACRITSAIPSFLFTNNLNGTIYIRKDPRMQPLKVESGKSIAVPWVSSKALSDPSNIGSTVASIEFKPTEDSHWSSPILLSESHSGQTYMCMRQEKSNKPLVFCVSVVPKGGTKYCSISYPQRANEGYVLLNQCPYIKAAMVRTFHQGGDSSSKGNGVYFTAKYGQSVHFGWQQPFLNKTRLCQVMLWLDKNTVAPVKPLVINIGSPAFRYRQVEVTTPEYASNYTVLVSAENRGDYISIEVNPSRPYLELARNFAESTSSSRTSISSIRAPSLSQYHGSDPGDHTPERRHSDTRGLLELNPDVLKSSEENVDGNDGDDDIVTEPVSRSLQMQIQLSQIGLSLVSHHLHEELIFLEMSTVSFVCLWNGDHQRLELRISDIQIDNQTEEKQMDEDQSSTILVNRRKATGQEHQRHVLQIYVDRPFASCKDLCLKKIFVALDDLEVDISDALLSRVYNFYKECMKCMGTWGSQQKVDLRLVDSWVQKESQEKLSSLDKNPIPPRMLVLDFLFIERFNLVLWCSFDLEKLHMLGDLMRMGLRIICVSRHFELMGAPLQFQQEYFCNCRGSIRSFYEQIKDKYVHAALGCIGSLLGYSSLLNIPKIPINVGRNTIEFAADAVDSVSSGIGSLLSKFTFDNEYINKRQRDRMAVPSGNMRDGILSASRSIGEGFISLTNIVTKPIEGAQKGGMGGFIRGLGKGLAGSIVKPIDKVGQAVSHVSRTIKVNMSRQLEGHRWCTEPCRRPRMLWGEYSQLKPYSLSDAEIRQQLGHKFAKNIVHCETVAKRNHPQSHLALLFYPSKVYYVDLKPKPTILWKVAIADIQECRASCYGVIIRASEGTLQVPCTNAGLIYSIFTALQQAKRQSKSSIVIGPELFASYK